MTVRPNPVEELAYAKLNLVLHVGPPQPNGLHAICSIFASLDLADDVHVRPGDGPDDRVECEGVEGPNLAAAALAAFRTEVPSLQPLDVRIHKRIPVAAGLGGGSADAAATLRAANRIVGEPLDAAELRAIAATLGSGASGWELAFENDLQPAALALRPELVAVIDRLRAAGALVARVSGSGPTCFGLFADRNAAEATAEAMPGALVTSLRRR